MGRQRLQKRQISLRQARFETLESRRVLAGMVSAAMYGGDLVLNGDSESNQVGIAIDGKEIVVYGLDQLTRINGQTELRLENSALKGDLKVNLKQGDDIIKIGGETHETHVTFEPSDEGEDHDEPRLRFPGHVFIATGPGNDEVRLSFVQVSGGLFIHTASDADLADVDLTDTELNIANIQALADSESLDQISKGDDIVTIGRGPTFAEQGHGDGHQFDISAQQTVGESFVTEGDGCGDEGEPGPPPDVFVSQGIFISTGPGEDGVKIAFTEVVGGTRVLTGPGSDYVVTGRGPIHGRHGGGGHEAESIALLSGEAVDDEADHRHQGGRPVDVKIGDDFRIDLGPGDDFVMLRNSMVGSNLIVAAHPGNDSVGAQNLIVKEDTSIKTAGGADTVALIASRFSNVSIDTGSGRDLVILHSLEVSGFLDLTCGRDDDTLAISTSRFADRVTFDADSGWDQLGLGIGAMSNEFEHQPSPNSLEFENLDPALVDEAIFSVVELFGGFLQGAII